MARDELLPKDTVMATEKDAILDRLRRQRELSRGRSFVDLRSEWVDATDALMGRIRDWLRGAEDEGLFSVERVPLTLQEPRLGTYDTRGLRLVSPDGLAITIHPKARQVAGGHGRVDMSSEDHKVILVRSDPGRWQVARLIPERGGWALIDLDEAEFWRAIDELIPNQPEWA